MCYLEDVREVSQVEDVVEAYRCRQEVLTDLLVQTYSRLDSENQKMVRCKNSSIDINKDKKIN